jgi:hypothetical protein
MLSEVLTEGAMVGARTVIAPDSIAADMWLRLAARSPFHDNASLRLRIESNMTTAQLADAAKRAAAWRPRPLDEVLAMTIALPAVAGAKPPWLRRPDFGRNEEVVSAITAIAAHCDSSGNKRCAETCRQQLDYLLPPIKGAGCRPRSSPGTSRSIRKFRRCAPCARKRLRQNSRWISGCCARTGSKASSDRRRRAPPTSPYFARSGRRMKMP